MTLHQSATLFYNYVYQYQAKIIAYKQWIKLHVGVGKI